MKIVKILKIVFYFSKFEKTRKLSEHFTPFRLILFFIQNATLPIIIKLEINVTLLIIFKFEILKGF